MAYRRRHHHRHHRRNPFGISGGLVKEAAFVAAGAVGAAALPGMVAPSFSTGWAGVAASGAAAIGMGFLGRFFGSNAGADMLKGGLAITVLKALNTAGIRTPGLGLYAPSWFGVPTASSQYLQSSQGNQPGFNRGGGTIIFPGPGGVPMVAAPAHGGRLGYHRFRSRYAGGYGG
jgi:hypothetical protein